MPHATAFNALHSFDFNTACNAEGWSPTNANLKVGHGSASGMTTAGEP